MPVIEPSGGGTGRTRAASTGSPTGRLALQVILVFELLELKRLPAELVLVGATGEISESLDFTKYVCMCVFHTSIGSHWNPVPASSVTEKERL